MQTLPELLQGNSYPGRGIMLGRCPCGGKAVLAYFIMGRSANSRNRVFTQTDFGLITEAADPAKLEDPSLIIYAPVRTVANGVIVTNGDQTDTIYNFMADGKSFEDALRTRTFEPDAPNLTPRISGLLQFDAQGGFGYKLSILKSNCNNADSAQRFFYEYSQPLPGEGHFISTYRQNGTPLPSFKGEPKLVATQKDIDTFGQALWAALDAENKVALMVQYIGKNETETRIYNRLQKV